MGLRALCLAAMVLMAAAGAARAQMPEPRSETWTIKDFRFHDGSILPEMKVHYLTLGDPKNPAVLMLHGTGGSGAGMLNPAFGEVLFAKGGALDASRYFIVLPDAIGHGESSKPSDGLRMKFPAYNYADMIEVQHQLLGHLGVKHLALVTGNSMGGMLSWQWAEQYPDFMDAIAPMASTPAAMAARNWVFRRLVIDAIETDPTWNGGNYMAQPKGLTLGVTYFVLLAAGGTQAMYRQLPTWKATDDLLAQRMAGGDDVGDANDTIYELLAARDYDPAPRLGVIKARVLAINSADDEKNPAELGLTAAAVKRLKGALYYEIPASAETSGHGTTGSAHWFAGELKRFMDGH